MDSKLDEKEIATLWQKYGETHGKEIRNKLLETYFPLVNIIAGRIAISLPSSIDRDDLVGSGFFGLLDAIERYDHKRQNKFETYAGVRIRGAMLDYLRDRDWIPYTVRKKIRAYEECINNLENTLGRNATDKEIAEAMGVNEEQFAKDLAQMNVATIVPLDDYIQAETLTNAAPSPQEKVEEDERKGILAKAIEKLSEKERKIIALYYHENLTMKEISLVMKISEARVCQLHTKAIFRLRGHLSREKENLM